MIFFADESLDRQIITRLRQDGHVVLDVTEMDPGISDDKVLSMANESKAILLTADRDFGDLVFRQGRITEYYKPTEFTILAWSGPMRTSTFQL